MKQKQANAILYSHCVSSLACASIFRNQEKQNPPAFQEFFDQQFRYCDTKPLTKKPEVSENHTLRYTSPLNKPPHPQGNRCPELLLTQEPIPNSNKQTDKQSLKDDDNMQTHRSVLRPHKKGDTTKTFLIVSKSSKPKFTIIQF